MPADKMSLDKAKQDKLFYFVANVIVYRESDARCLILKRDEREIAHPGRWGVIGGKLEWGDMPIDKPTRVNGDVLDFEHAIENLLHREAKEEAGITIKDEFHYINSVAFIRPDGVPVVFVKFAAPYKSGKVKIEKGSFTDFAWVTEAEVKSYACIDGIDEEIRQATQHFRND